MEAAELDGANAWQRFWYLAVPLIRPVLLVVALLQVIWDLRVFTQIYVLQQRRRPDRETQPARHLHLLAREGVLDGRGHGHDHAR